MEIVLEEERKTEKYKVTLNIDIENIVKIENTQNHYNDFGEQYTKLYNKNYLMKLTFP